MSDNDTSTTFETVSNTPQTQGINFNTKSNSLKIKADKHSYISKFNNKLKKGKTRKKGTLVFISLILMTITILVVIFNKPSTPIDDSVFVINEDSYISSFNKIYSNLDLFIGKNISLSGMLKTYEVDNKKYMMVYRNTPGNSGNNGIVGFDFEYVDMQELKENSWISVTGMLIQNNDDNHEYLKIEATSVTPIIDTKDLNEFVIK